MPHIGRRSHRQRGGFTVSSFSVLMLIVFLGVAAAQMWQASGRPGFGVHLVAGFLAVPVMLAISVGAVAYLAFKKSDTAGNGAFTFVLLLATIGRLAYMMGVIPQGTSTSTLLRGNPPASPGAQQAGSKSRGESAPSLGEASTRQRPSAKELLEALTPKPPPGVNPGAGKGETGVSGGTGAQGPGPSSAPPRAGSPINRGPLAPRAPAPRVPRESTVEERAVDEAVTRVVEVFKSDLDAAAGAFSIQAETVMDLVSKAPRVDRGAIDQRLKDLEALKIAASELRERYEEAQNELKKRLVDAGAPEHRAVSESIRWTIDYNTMWRGSGCRDYAMMCDAAEDEAQYLRDHLGKWSFDSSGDITSKDPSIKGRAGGLRLMVQSYLKRREEMAGRLRGK